MLENRTKSIIKQLSFQLSSIYEVKHDEKRKFGTELLNKDDDDYKFILRSIHNKSAGDIPKIRHLFRIYSVDKNKVLNFKQKFLYLNGIKADKIKYVLTNGYPKDQSNCFHGVLNHATTNLRLATHVFRRNYCEVDNTVKRLSFVFVVSSEDNYEESISKNKKFIEDSRKNVTREEIFVNLDYDGPVKSIFNLVPAYLIVFELDD